MCTPIEPEKLAALKAQESHAKRAFVKRINCLARSAETKQLMLETKPYAVGLSEDYLQAYMLLAKIINALEVANVEDVTPFGWPC